MGNVAARVIGVASLMCLTSVATAAELIFTAPPRESAGQGADDYQPIAELLSKATGQRVTYRHSDNWLTYQSGMQKDAYDLVFDGPHFIGWRMAVHSHMPLVKLPGNLAFVVVVRAGETRFQSVENLAGHTLCAHAPPNLATLTTLAQFPNPSRQPLVIEVKGFKPAYESLLAGKCVATVLPVAIHGQLDKDKTMTRVLSKSKPVPNQALTVSKRVPTEMRAKIVNALLSPEGTAASAGLLARFNKDKFEPANPSDYEGLGVLLKDVWGFAQ
ncbi:MAG TPA: PhnD/SsuA/transferrin family substrate-binding protein [Acidiferrobacterales bacterium]|jgi:ABC-type phosphate/phosphonate transport system substrate-binding protein